MRLALVDMDRLEEISTKGGLFDFERQRTIHEVKSLCKEVNTKGSIGSVVDLRYFELLSNLKKKIGNGRRLVEVSIAEHNKKVHTLGITYYDLEQIGAIKITKVKKRYKRGMYLDNNWVVFCLRDDQMMDKANELLVVHKQKRKNKYLRRKA